MPYIPQDNRTVYDLDIERLLDTIAQQTSVSRS